MIDVGRPVAGSVRSPGRVYFSWLGWMGGCIVVVGFVGGCNSPRPELVRVDGVVTIDDVPLRDGTVVMICEEGAHRGEARSPVDTTGGFTMVHDAFADVCGVPPGDYRFIVTAFGMPSEANGRPTRAVPERFADPTTSDLTLTIVPGSTGEHVTIALKRSGESRLVTRRADRSPQAARHQ